MIDPLKRPARMQVELSEGDKVILCEGRDECEVLNHFVADWPRKPVIGTRGEEKPISANRVRFSTIEKAKVASVYLINPAAREKGPA